MFVGKPVHNLVCFDDYTVWGNIILQIEITRVPMKFFNKTFVYTYLKLKPKTFVHELIHNTGYTTGCPIKPQNYSN